MRIFIIALAGAVALAGLAVAVIYGLSERELRDYPVIEAFSAEIPDDPATIEKGRHAAQIRGCFGCHGAQLQGVASEYDGTVEVAPNLAAYVRAHDVATMERALRHGVGSDGRALWSMPSYNFKNLSDSDLVAIIAFLQSAPVAEEKLPRARLAWNVRWVLATEDGAHIADWVRDTPGLAHQGDGNPAVARGEYLAMTTCNECHGFDLRGNLEGARPKPDLAIVASYPEEDFIRLMREGVGVGGRSDLGLMSSVAKSRFAHFTDQEIADLQAFFAVMATETVPEGVWQRESE